MKFTDKHGHYVKFNKDTEIFIEGKKYIYTPKFSLSSKIILFSFFGFISFNLHNYYIKILLKNDIDTVIKISGLFSMYLTSISILLVNYITD